MGEINDYEVDLVAKNDGYQKLYDFGFGRNK